MPDITFTVLVDNTPASPEIMEAIQEVYVENNVDMADVFRLRIAIGRNGQGDWTTLEDDPFQPLTPIALHIQLDTGASESLISGYVTSQQTQISSEPGQSFLEVVGMDATVLMNLEDKIVAWPNLADSDIATKIFGDYGFVSQVDQTQPARQEQDTTTLQRSTDIQFLRQLAKRNGFECYVERDPIQNVDIGHFHSPRLQDNPQGTLAVSFGEETSISSFRTSYEMLRPIRAKASNIDIYTQSTQNSDVQSGSLIELGRTPLHERLPRQPLILVSKTALESTTELQAFCQGLVDRSIWAITAQGQLNTAVYGGILRAHQTVNIRGAGNLYSGTYYVTRVLHSFVGDSYTQHFKLKRNAIGLIGSENFTSLL